MRKLTIALIASLLVGAQAYGAMIGQGTRALGLSGRIDKSDEFNLVVNGRFGYFIMDAAEVGGGAGLSQMDGGDWVSFTANVYGEYNFDIGMDPVVPFAGASGGIRYEKMDFDGHSQSETVLEVVGYGGAKYYLVDPLAIWARLDLMFATEEIYAGDSELTMWDWVIRLGTSFYF